MTPETHYTLSDGVFSSPYLPYPHIPLRTAQGSGKATGSKTELSVLAVSPW
jgi:hypothetical protein